MVHREADVSLSVSGLFWWEHLHFEGSRKLLHSRLIHSCLNGTSTTIGVINVRRANKEQIRAFSRINKPGLPSILPRKGPCLKKHWLNLIELKIRSVFSSTVFLWYSLSAVIRLWLLSHFSANQMQLVGCLKSKVEFVLHWVWNRRLPSSVWIKEKLLQVTFVQIHSGMDVNSGQSSLPWHVFYI